MRIAAVPAAFDDEHPHRRCAKTGSPHARWALVERRGRGNGADARRSGRVERAEPPPWPQ